MVLLSIRSARLLMVLGIVAAVLVTTASPAAAHPFLVVTEPLQGSRLSAAPRLISLQFSEPLGPSEPKLSLVDLSRGADLSEGGQTQRLVTSPAAGGRVVQADVDLVAGLYQVRWEVVADDGHQSGGEFAFAVGPVTGSLPSERAVSAPAGPLRSGLGLVFFAGLAMVVGALATASMVDRDSTKRARVRRLGLALALAAASGLWAAGATGSGGPVAPARQMNLLAFATVLLAVGLLVWRRPVVVAALTVTAAGAWSMRGQVAVARGPLGSAVDLVHLLGATTWVGALGLLVVDLRRTRHTGADLSGAARRYARLAVVVVVGLALAGGVSALLVVPRPADLWSTGYGRLLAVKTALFAGAVGLAWQARRRGLLPGASSVLARLARLEAVLVAAVLALAAVLANTSPPPAPASAASLLGPPPLAGPVARDAGLAGILTVAVAATADELRVEVLVPSGAVPGIRGDIRVVAPGSRADRALRVRSCGDGCWRGPWQPTPGPVTVQVSASAPGWRGGSYDASIDWPPPTEDPALLARLIATMRAASQVELTELTSSGPDSTPTPRIFQSSGDKVLSEEPYASGVATDIRPLADGTGLKLYLPGDRIWVTLRADPAGRIEKGRIVSVGHLIERSYSYPS